MRSARWRRAVRWPALWAAALAASSGLARDDAGEAIAVTVGTTRLSVAAIEHRLAQMPWFQLRALGASAPAITRRFVQEVLVPELLHAEEAGRLRLEQTPEVQARVDGLLQRALEQELREKLQREHPITEEQVRRYYAANRQRFSTPARIRIWRILVTDAKLGERILEDAAGPDGIKKWAQHAREHSLDRATAMRRGDLGFVRPDGRTDRPRVRVDAALFAAAEQVSDGQLVAQPVAEGEHFAVVWRRGSLPAVMTTLAQAADSIREALLRSQLQDALDGLVGRLYREHVSELHAELLELLETPLPEFAPRSRTPVRAARPPAGAEPPRRTTTGLR